MRASTIVMIVLAGVFGLLAVFVAQAWLSRQDEQLRLKSELNQPKPAATRMVVVAASALRFGNPLTSGNLRETPWPEGALPEGSFSSIQDVLAAGKRIVLAPIEPNEPVLATKLTGPGQRATLSAVLHEGMKAVTVEVDTLAAEKLTLASQVGTLSLALRKAGESLSGDQRRISAEDLGRDTAPAAGPKKFSTVTVVRAGKREEYGVPADNGETLETAEAARATKQR